MGPEVIVFTVFFGVIFGIYYLYITARNRERMALIEKGADATIFYKGKRSVTPVWKVIVLNLALLLMGIGIGILLAAILQATTTINKDVLFPGTIFLMAGTGLLVGFFLTKKLNEDV